jgi:hypothetical protein
MKRIATHPQRTARRKSALARRMADAENYRQILADKKEGFEAGMIRAVASRKLAIAEDDIANLLAA